MLTIVALGFCKNQIDIFAYFYHLSTFRKRMKSKSMLIKINGIFTLHSQNRGCKWLGDARSQGASSHATGLVIQEYSVFSNRRVNTYSINTSWAQRQDHVEFAIQTEFDSYDFHASLQLSGSGRAMLLLSYVQHCLMNVWKIWLKNMSTGWWFH